VRDLAESEIIELRNLATRAESVNDKIDVIFKILQMKFVGQPNSEAETNVKNGNSATSQKTFLMFFLALLTVLAAHYNISKNYPMYVFAWADAQGEFEKILEKRKVIWQTCFVATAVNIGSSIIFSYGFSS
jgi:hypothetical protein